MIYKLYCIKDTLVGFMKPFIQVNDAVAVREFKTLVNTPDNAVAVNFENMELYCLGSFNQDTGSIESKVDFLIKASDVKDVANG